VARTRLTGPAATVEVVDFLPWAGPGTRPPGRLVRLATVLAGTADLTAEVAGGTGRPASVVAAGMVAGQRQVVVVDGPGQEGRPLPAGEADDLLARTRTAWRAHLRDLAYDGFHPTAVRRSLLTLAALTDGTTGALLHSPTEPVCRLLDVARAADLELDLGLLDEAARHLGWLLGALDGRPPLPAASTLGGEPVEGEGGVAPAPLAAYASLAGCLRRDRPTGDAEVGRLGDGMRRVADWLAAGWGAEASTVADDLAAWHALEAMAGAATAEDPLDMDAPHWHRAAAQLEEWLPDGFDGAAPEPALLRVAWLGPWAGTADPAGLLVQRVLDHWDVAGDDGEVAAPAARFAAVEALAALARWDEAHERMESLLSAGAAGDLSAATQLGLIRAARALSAGPR